MAVILIGMADLNIARAPDSLTTLGLGSCVGVTLYDKINKIAGMAHIMLPSSLEYSGQNRAKFADTAIEDLVSKMAAAGALRTRLAAKIAGGAHMFGSMSNNILKVGDRNAAACLQILQRHGIPVTVNETGGNYGRTIEIYAETGLLRIKTVGYGEKTV